MDTSIWQYAPFYNVNDVPKGSVGGMEWHGIRTEFVSALGGRRCVADVYGIAPVPLTQPDNLGAPI